MVFPTGRLQKLWFLVFLVTMDKEDVGRVNHALMENTKRMLNSLPAMTSSQATRALAKRRNHRVHVERLVWEKSLRAQTALLEGSPTPQVPPCVRCALLESPRLQRAALVASDVLRGELTSRRMVFAPNAKKDDFEQVTTRMRRAARRVFWEGIRASKAKRLAFLVFLGSLVILPA